VTLKYLVTAHHFLDTDPIEAVLFESEDSIGGTFAHRTYEDAEVREYLSGRRTAVGTKKLVVSLVKAAYHLLRFQAQ
jgi:hypothetical protein